MSTLRFFVIVAIAAAVGYSPHVGAELLGNEGTGQPKHWPELMRCAVYKVLHPMQHVGTLKDLMASRPARQQQQQAGHRSATGVEVPHSTEHHWVHREESAVATGVVMPTRKLLRGKWSQVRGWYNMMDGVGMDGMTRPYRVFRQRAEFSQDYWG